MECLLETGAGINFQRKLWKFHHLQLDRNELDKAPENILSGMLMFCQVDDLDDLKSSFSIWYSMKAQRPIAGIITSPWSREAPHRAWEKKGGRTSNVSHKHNPAMHCASSFPPQSPCTENILQSFIAFKIVYLTKCLPGRVLALNQKDGRTFTTSLCYPLWSTGVLLPYWCHCCPRDALVVGSTITKYR